MPITWANFKAAVIDQLGDHIPSSGISTLAVEAVAEYVNAKAMRALTGSVPLAATHENRYKELRRKLAGRTTALSASAFNDAVRARLRSSPESDDIGYRYIGAVAKAEVAREYEQDVTLEKSLRDSALAYKLQMLGRTFTASEAATITAVRARWLPLDDDTLNLTVFIDEAIKRARDDLQTFKTWVDGLITAGLEELQSIAARVQIELLNGVVELQEKVPGLRESNFTTYTTAGLVDDGFASRGLIPEDGRPIAAWIVDIADDDEDLDVNDDEVVDDPCRRTPVAFVPWSGAQNMACLKTCTPQISINLAGRCFYITPQIVAEESEFLLQWSGVKSDFADADDVSFDHAMIQAVAEHIKFVLASEDGDRMAAQTAVASRTAAWRRVYRNSRFSRETEMVDHGST